LQNALFLGASCARIYWGFLAFTHEKRNYSARESKHEQPNAEIAKVTQKSQKSHSKGIFGCFFCGISAPSAFGCPIFLVR
jgi:hypothetical protein